MEFVQFLTEGLFKKEEVNMKKFVLILAVALIGVNASAMSSASSMGSYTDVECDMTDLTCYKLILEMGRQDAIIFLMNGGQSQVTVELKKAIEVFRKMNGGAEFLTDEEIIALLASHK